MSFKIPLVGGFDLFIGENVLWRLYRNLRTILEEHFGKHQRSGGCSDNPTLETFQRQEVAFGLINSDLISGMMGNTTGRPYTRPSIDMKMFDYWWKEQKKANEETR